MGNKIQIRRGVVGDLPALDTGELGLATDTGQVYIGNSGNVLLGGTSSTHAQQHAITSTSDHTSTATAGRMLKADANGLPVDATNTDAEVSGAVTASHAAVTLDANADTLLSLSTQALGLDTQTANQVLAGPTTGAAAVPTFRALVAADLPATYIESGLLTTRGDLIRRSASAPERYGLVVPSSPTLNFLGVANGEVDPTWKSASSNPGAAAAVLQSNASGVLQLQGLIAPYIRPAADSTTALQMQNAAGTSVLNVNTTNGYIGIGTTVPVGKLHVAGGTSAMYFTTTDYAAGTTGTSLEMIAGAATGNTTGQIRVYNNGSTSYGNLVLQTGGGNVLIGTTADTAITGARLRVNGGIDIFGTGTSYIAGNVGIGTTSPASALDMVGVSPADGLGILRITNTSANNYNTGLTFTSVNNSNAFLQLRAPTNADATPGVSLTDTNGSTGSIVTLERTTSQILNGTRNDLIILNNSNGNNILFGTNNGSNGERMRITSSGNVGIGTTSPDRLTHAEVSNAVTNAITYAQRLSHITSGTAAAGFGTGTEFELEDDTGTNRVTGYIESLYNSAATASWKADLVLKSADSGGVREGIRIRGTGSAAAIAFLGATPSARLAHVADPSGGATVDAEARTAINSILTTLETFGFHATS